MSETESRMWASDKQLLLYAITSSTTVISTRSRRYVWKAGDIHVWVQGEVGLRYARGGVKSFQSQ